MAYVLLTVFLILIVVSFDKSDCVDSVNSYDRVQQLSMRGVCAVIIVFSHMYRNTQIYSNPTASGIVSIFSPSLLCLFFFYSGYAAMYKYKIRGEVKLSEYLLNWIKSLIAPAAVALLLNHILGHVFGTLDTEINFFDLFNDLGGWFLKTYIILQFVFWVSSLLKNRIEQIWIILTILIMIVMVVMKVIGLESFYFIDCLAFSLGAYSCVHEALWKKILDNPHIYVVATCFTLVVGGAIPTLFRAGILPVVGGVGLVIGVLNSLTQCIMFQGLISRRKFSPNNLFMFLGRFSYEIYLLGPVAYLLAIHTAKTSATYYVVYCICCILGGFLVSKFCKSVFSIAK